MSGFDLTDSYYSIFIKETTEQLELMEHDFIELEAGQYNDEILNNIFRSAHSMKSSCAAIEFSDMSRVAHSVENVLIKLRNKELLVTTKLMDVLFLTLDELKNMFMYFCESEDYSPDVIGIENTINNFIDSITSSKPEAGSLDFNEKEANILKEMDKTYTKYKLLIFLEKELDFKAIKVVMIVKELNKYGTINLVIPEDYEDLEDQQLNDSITILFSTKEQNDNFITKLKGIKGIKEVQYEKFIEKEARKNLDSKKEISSINVDIERIDKLINLAGEFVIEKESLNKISNQLRLQYKQDPLISRLIDSIIKINYIGSELQETILSTRMLSLEYVFNRFPRIIRDLSIKCGKEIELSILGSETEIDRGMIEQLIDPMTHILRNTVDHGIEFAEIRKAKGKPPAGQVTINARHEENRVIIEIIDDGQGLNIPAIKKKAIQKNILTEDQINIMSEDEIIDIIFEPGFSTSETVSEISGRGVGMDVLRSNISKLNGIVEVSTEKDKGTKFIIKLPLTLAIIKALLVKEQSFTFAIPISFIVEIIILKEEDIKDRIYSVGTLELFSWRNQGISLIRLADYFDIGQNKENTTYYAIVVGYSERRIAIVVNEIFEEQEIVIKSMEEYIGKNKIMGLVQGISGASILGDGSFAHVLDIPSISREFYMYRRGEL